MRIEKLLPPPQPGKPWSVALEGGEVLQVSESVVASFALYGGMELEGETLTALQEAAALAGTIQYELLCAVSPRVPREYLEQDGDKTL